MYKSRHQFCCQNMQTKASLQMMASPCTKYFPLKGVSKTDRPRMGKHFHLFQTRLVQKIGRSII